MISRRHILTLAAAPLALGAPKKKYRIGVTDWNLGKATKPEALTLAKELGFEGVEVSIGRQPVNGKMPLDDAALIEQYKTQSKSTGIHLNSSCLQILHVNGLKNDPTAPKWVSEGIRITKALGTNVMLLPFFGERALKTKEEMERTADALRELGPEAEKAGIVLALENTISAEDNVRIMERSRSKAVKVFYDVGNSTGAGFDILKEIRWLGTSRIAQVHLKDNPNYLGEGKIDFRAVLAALDEIGYKGWADFETSSPAKDIPGDMKRNLAYIRKLMSS
jgi:sugar phosphate isomerase/epimerase